MKRTLICNLAMASLLAMSSAGQANTVVWEASRSLIDTTNYTGLAPYFWFANFNNPNAVVGAPLNASEASTLPPWLHFETDPAFIGKDDSGVNNDATIRTGFSFSESGVATTSTGGQPSYNTLTLPDGTSGRSGFAEDDANTSTSGGNTSSMLAMRVLAGAPDRMRIWLVTDNGVDPNFNAQSRARINLRDSVGPPLYGDASASVSAEANPGGGRLIPSSGGDPRANNGTADAWAFLLGSVQEHDIITVQMTSNAAFESPGFAGIIFQPIPEPATLGLAGAGALALLALRRRRGV